MKFTRKRLSAGLTLTLVALIIVLSTTNVRAAVTEKVLHSFTLTTDGGTAVSGLVADANGNLYGTTEEGGSGGFGNVFELIKGTDGEFTFQVIHSFVGSFSDGANPLSSVVLDTAGNLYGATPNGGGAGCGVIYKLSPRGNGQFSESILYSFNSLPNNNDGCNPQSYLIFDKAGNLYGTTNKGGGGAGGTFCLNGCGTVFRLSPTGNGQFTETIIHSFPGTRGNTDGQNPVGGLVFDQAGNLWGSTPVGGVVKSPSNACGAVGFASQCGTVFELTPNPDGTFTESTLYSFTGDSSGFNPNTNLVIDNAGNLYGTTVNGGFGNGAVFRITPQSDGGVKESIIHAFATCNATTCPDGLHPFNGLNIDAKGDLIGTVDLGGGANNNCSPGSSVFEGCGIVYALTPNPDGSFKEIILYRFLGGATDGGVPEDDRLVVDAKDGTIFGATAEGGDLNNQVCLATNGCGVVFRLTVR